MNFLRYLVSPFFSLVWCMIFGWSVWKENIVVPETPTTASLLPSGLCFRLFIYFLPGFMAGLEGIR